MFILSVLSIISMIILFVFVTLCLACGLYYLAEITEEYSHSTRDIIQASLIFSVACNIFLVLFDGFPVALAVVGIIAHGIYATLLPDFPMFEMVSPKFIGSVVILVLHHYMAFTSLGELWLTFFELLGFFTTCVWLVPFEYFVSLSSGEYSLPQQASSLGGGGGGLGSGDPGIRGAGMSSGGDGMVGGGGGGSRAGGMGRVGVLSVLNYLMQQKENILPTRRKHF
eukprot:Nk52_evm1s1448 gene=Nk52_evmTU1s1448